MIRQPVSERSIRVCVADRQSLVRKGICALMAAEPDLDVVGEAETPAVLDEVLERKQPDVVLIDSTLFPDDDSEAMYRIITHHPAQRVLVLASVGGDERIFMAIKAGAVGVLLKSCEPDDLLRAIREVQRGGAWLEPAVARRLLDEITHTTRLHASGDTLTERELDVLRLVAHGYSNQQIANQLVICEGTVRVHVSNILSKLHLASRTQAALYALNKGLATLDES
jgi:NarL family two-component system response regulator LiaR